MAKHSKAYRAAVEKIEADRLYSPLEAVRLAQATSTTKYDSTVEVAFRLGVDPRKADQMVRGTVNLPHGTGKTARVIVFATGERAEQARAAGADEVGGDELIDKVAAGYTDFDSAVATPDLMGKVGRLGKVLGPRGLMPNPKTGTVTMDVAKAVSDIKGGKIEFRVDRHANLHFIIGKTSFSDVGARGELRRRARRDPASEAVRLEGPLHRQGDVLDDERPRHPRRPEQDAEPPRGRRRLTAGSSTTKARSPLRTGPSSFVGDRLLVRQPLREAGTALAGALQPQRPVRVGRRTGSTRRRRSRSSRRHRRASAGSRVPAWPAAADPRSTTISTSTSTPRPWPSNTSVRDVPPERSRTPTGASSAVES